MPVATIGFMLKPAGFFDRNPALDVPRPTPNGHCCQASEGGSAPLPNLPPKAGGAG